MLHQKKEWYWIFLVWMHTPTQQLIILKVRVAIMFHFQLYILSVSNGEKYKKHLCMQSIKSLWKIRMINMIAENSTEWLLTLLNSLLDNFTPR